MAPEIRLIQNRPFPDVKKISRISTATAPEVKPSSPGEEVKFDVPAACQFEEGVYRNLTKGKGKSTPISAVHSFDAPTSEGNDNKALTPGLRERSEAQLASEAPQRLGQVSDFQ
jgi:hypothetical protein